MANAPIILPGSATYSQTSQRIAPSRWRVRLSNLTFVTPALHCLPHGGAMTPRSYPQALSRILEADCRLIEPAVDGGLE